MSDEATFDPDSLRKEFADYCADVEPGIKAKAPKLNQLETLALIGMSVFQAAKELKAEKAQQAARIAELEAQIDTVAPAVDAQPVASEGVRHFNYLCSLLPEGFHWSDPLTPDVMSHIVSAASAQSEGLRKDAEELLRRIPTTPEQMIDFIGSHFDSMEAQEWSEFSGEAMAKPAGDLSMVRYSLTVHDLLSAFDWADLNEYAIDAALSQHKAGEKDD